MLGSDQSIGGAANVDLPAPRSLDQRLLLDSVATLGPRARWGVLAAATLLTFGWAALPNGDLRDAWGLPDVMHYVAMARGHYEQVPAPFSSRPLAPLLARWLSGSLHGDVLHGFAALALVSVLLTAGGVFWLALRSRAPRWVLLLLAAVPFWPQLLGYAGLPDPLYTVLLAGLLVTLECGWIWTAALLMLPLTLTRESTSLTLVCLLLVGWRQLRWRGAAVAVGSVALGTAVVRHLSAGSLPNPEHMSGGLYLVGKVVSNTVRSLGVLPWSNVYPELCGAPAWQHALHIGPVRSVGYCAYSAVTVQQAVLGLLTTFGLLPMVLLAVGRAWRQVARDSLLVRFCLLYGGVSLLIAPMLGTWYARLFGYGWPLLLVAVPRLLGALPSAERQARAAAARWMAVGCLQVVVAALALRAFQPGVPVWIGGCEAVAAALLFVQWRSFRGAVPLA